MYGNSGFGWIWFLWMGIIFVMFSSFGNWGYTYRVHRKFDGAPKGALDILDERCACGEIARDEYASMKPDIARAPTLTTSR